MLMEKLILPDSFLKHIKVHRDHTVVHKASDIEAAKTVLLNLINQMEGNRSTASFKVSNLVISEEEGL